MLLAPRSPSLSAISEAVLGSLVEIGCWDGFYVGVMWRAVAIGPSHASSKESSAVSSTLRISSGEGASLAAGCGPTAFVLWVYRQQLDVGSVCDAAGYSAAGHDDLSSR